jgi:hypothetical protein
LGEATIVPNRMREVTPAAAASVGTASNQGPSTRSRQPMWSYVQACANPYSSARRHRPAAADQRWSGRITMPARTGVTPAIAAPLPQS